MKLIGISLNGSFTFNHIEVMIVIIKKMDYLAVLVTVIASVTSSLARSFPNSDHQDQHEYFSGETLWHIRCGSGRDVKEFDTGNKRGTSASMSTAAAAASFSLEA